MDRKNPIDLLEHVKSLVKDTGDGFYYTLDITSVEVSYSDDLSKEVKSNFDKILEKEIINGLLCLDIPILSEEAGYINENIDSEYLFIVDPLDGTFNFTRGLGPYAISVALWSNNKPIFGVVYNLLSKELIWGSKETGSYCDNNKIQVSDVDETDSAVLCTGFPVRYNFSDINHDTDFINIIKSYSKIRMIGSATISLINVAKGSADVYSEKDIMIWDVAAGIAIVEGSGGQVYYENAVHKNSLNVFASNIPLYKYNFLVP
jgi:myo-inositol-1(or 4)-monophosphatase